MENYKKRTSLTNYNLEGEYPKGPVYPEIKKFMVESRKCQTLYANCEGSYSRRVLDLKDKKTLENFVYCTMYFNGSRSWDDEENFSKREHVEKITYEMIKTSKSFQVEEEIHFGVAWVYYFSYEKKTQKATPVFKIYKSKTGNEAVFLDISLTLYNSWECYLDASSSVFPVSFLCLPRNGDYRFLGSDEGNAKGLDLEFVCSRKVISKSDGKKFRFEFSSSSKYVPFCQVAVRPWLIKISRVKADVIRKIKAILSTLWSGISKSRRQCFNVVVYGLLFLLHMKEKNISFSDALKMMANDSLMLLNTVSSEDGSLKNCLTDAFFSKMTTSISGFSNFNNAVESLTKFQVDGKFLLELLKNQKKNWCDILRTFCDLFNRSKPILVAISRLFPLPPILNILFFLLNGLSSILEFYCMGNIKNLETDRGQLMKGMTLRDADIISDSEPSVKPTGSQLVECFRETRTYLEDVESKRINVALENALSNLGQLETISSEMSQKQFFEESALMYERHRQFPTSDSSQILTHFVFLGNEDGYGFFFIPCASLPRLTNTINQLIEEPFIFKPESESMWSRVVLESGKTIGYLFFPKEYCAIALLSLQAINKESQTLLESESFLNKNYLQQVTSAQ